MNRLPYSLPTALERATDSAPVAAAVVDGDVHLTYQSLSEQAHACAMTLASAGLHHGDRIGLLLPRSANAIAWFFGVVRVGAIAVWIHESLRPRQIAHIVRDSGMRLAVATPRLRSLLPADVPALDDGTQEPVAAAELPRGPIGDDVALLIYTSGSTGRPKGVVVTHRNLLAGAIIVSDYLSLTAADRVVTTLPFSFDYGLNQVVGAVWNCGSVVVERSPLPAAICRTIQRHGVTGMAGVPLFWQQMCSHASPFLSPDWEFPSLRYITNSGGALPVETVQRLRKRRPGVSIYLMYGLTEAFRSTYLPPDEVDDYPSSIGRAVPDTEILVVRDDGTLCAPGETGELVHRGPTTARGYWRDVEGTHRVFRPDPRGRRDVPLEDRVVYSGDLVSMDADGRLFYVGRRDAAFKSRGYRANPEEIEEHLYASGDVEEAVVFPRPVEGDNEIVAVVVLRRRADAKHNLEDFVAQNLPRWMQPAEIVVLDALPRTPNGKPDRQLIRRQVNHELGARPVT